MSGDYENFRGTRQGKYFPSWRKYLSAYTASGSLDDAIRSINKSSRRLNDNLEEPTVLPGVPLRDVIAPARIAPWPTFVLGSGCLTARDWAEESGGTSKADLSDALERVSRDRVARAQTLSFVDNLALNRSERSLDSPGLSPAPRSAEHWDFIARTALAATLLTRLYGHSIAESAQIVTDSHRERITLPRNPFTRREYIAPLEAELKKLTTKPTEGRALRSSLASLAESILASLEGGEVQRAHVELLSAFLWFLLTEDTFLYPDWSDLLLFEAFMDEELMERIAEDEAWHDSQLKPSTTAMGSAAPVARWLTARLAEISENSWASRDDARRSPTPRDEFYDAIAAILGQQADRYHSFEDVGSDHKPPLPTGFVTTFDLELEMAMWQRSLSFAEPRPFVVIVPVVVPEKTKTSVSLRWAWREVVPTADGDQLRALRDGGTGAWTLIGKGGSLPGPLRDTPETWGRTPVIVRLAGSPLMSVDVAGITDLRQALLLDEYTAVSHTVLDLTAAAQSSPYTNTLESMKGLPASLTESRLTAASAYMPRYWMFLGTQLNDSGVRMRLLSNQIAFAAQNVKDGVSENVAGMAINRRSRPNDREVFHWFGLDVVKADVVGSVTEPLRKLHSTLEGVFDTAESSIRAAIERDEWA